LKKIMLSVAMLAMVLAAAAPALGQEIGGNQGPVGGDDAVQAGDNFQYAAVCQNIIGWFQTSASMRSPVLQLLRLAVPAALQLLQVGRSRPRVALR
jgi:hypothetical protein